MDDTPQTNLETKPPLSRWRRPIGVLLWLGVLYFAFLATRVDFVTVRVMPYMGMMVFAVAAIAHATTSVVDRMLHGLSARAVKILKWPVAILLSVFLLRGTEYYVMDGYVQSVQTQLATLVEGLHENPSAEPNALAELINTIAGITSLEVRNADQQFSIGLGLPAIDIDGYIAYYASANKQWYYYHNDVPADIRPHGSTKPIPPIADNAVTRRVFCRRETAWSCRLDE